MKPPAKRKPSREQAVAKTVGAGGVTLAERISTAPRPIDTKAAHARLADWVSGLASVEKPFRELLGKNPIVSMLLQSLAESSPFLWDLVRRDPERLLRLLQRDPDRQLAASLSEYGRDISCRHRRRLVRHAGGTRAQ
jgi:glutamate-ammonia-ligase adenylyltransferase